MTTGLKPLLITSVLVGVAACDERPVVSPVSSSPVSPPVVSQISGTVREHTATTSLGRPAAGVRVELRFPGLNRYSETVSDATGHYQFTLPMRLGVFDQVNVALSPGSDYRAPCPPGTYGTQFSGTDLVLDLHVVSTAVLSTTGIPGSYPTASPVSSLQARGRVVGPAGPVAGAAVELFYSPFPMSSTLTDRNGAFLLCTPGRGGSEEELELRISKEGYQSAQRTLLFGLTGNDIYVELVPR